MQIITIDHAHFPQVRTAFVDATTVGKYWKNGKAQIVRATDQFLFIASEIDLSKIAIKPVRSLADAQSLGMQLLTREESKGNQVERL